MIGVGLSIVQLAVRQLLGFNPATLFAAGEQGAWWDPSDMSTLFQDSAGTTPVTAVEQPVGLMLDKSKGLVLGSELVTNGNFSSGATGWTFEGGASVVSGSLNFAGVAVLQGATNIGTVAANKFYQVTFTVVSVSAGGVSISNGTTNGTARLTAGTYTEIFNSGAAGSIKVIARSTTTTAVIDNISVRELPGNHAFQSTSASRPVLSARVNLLTKTEQFDDAVWVKTQSSVVANNTTAPNSTLTADTFLDVSGASFAELKQTSVPVVSGAQYRYTIRAKKGTKRYLYMSLTNARFGAGAEAYFDLELGVVKTSGAAAISTSVTQDSEGFYTCGFSANCTSYGNAELFLYHVNDAGTSVLYTGTGTGSIYIWGADLRVANDGVGLPAYQRVNTSTDYDTTGFPMYLRFDGVDDFMITNSINFTSTDKMTVWAGVRKLSDAATALLAELSVSTDTNAGAFYVGAPSSGGITKFSFNSRGSVFPATPVGTASATYSAPVSAVVAAIGSISEDTRTLRLNSTVVATGGGVDQGTGNFGNYPLYIGRRGGTSLPFNGRLHSLIIRGAQSTAEQIAATETYVNSKTKAFA